MKKTFVAALAALALVSCSKEETVTYGTNGEPLDGAAVCLTFTDAPASRASLNSTAAAETWEKSLTSLTVYVFNSQGNLVAQRSFTSEELADKSATFALPHSAAGTTCDFYAVANLSLTGVTTKSALLSKVEASAADYNGTFAEVSTKAKRAGGFVMSASASKSIAEGSTTDVAMALRRTVAKLSVQTTIDAAFAEKYSGTITVTGVKLSKAASQSPVIAPATPSPGAMSYTHTQTATAAAGRYDNLFYVFENGALPRATVYSWRSRRATTPTAAPRRPPTVRKSSIRYLSRARQAERSCVTATTASKLRSRVWQARRWALRSRSPTGSLR